MRMPFGKFKGEELLDIPVGYLEWCLDNLELDLRLETEMTSAIELLRAEETRRGTTPKD